MKKKNKKNQIRMRLSKILLCILAILLCAAPRSWAFSMYCTEDRVYYNNDVYCDDDDGKYDVTEQLINTARDELGLEGELDMLEVGAGATVNLYTSVTYFVQAHPGSVLNIYSGSVGLYVVLSLSTDESKPIVTVYGTNFEVDLECNGTFVSLDGADEFTPITETGSVLTGFYGNDDSDPIELKFYSKIPIYLMETAVSEVKIDIKPGGNPNNINLKSKGVVSVAVLTTGDFDASDVDPTSVVFAGTEPVRWTLCDVDGDGDDDRLFHFKTQYLVDLDENSTEATLTGETFDGVGIELTDTVRIVQSKKK